MFPYPCHYYYIYIKFIYELHQIKLFVLSNDCYTINRVMIKYIVVSEYLIVNY